MGWTFECPDGCRWVLPLDLLNKYGLPFDGVACPRHRVYCMREGWQQRMEARMPKKQHAALKRKGYSDETAYKIMNAQKSKRKKSKKKSK